MKNFILLSLLILAGSITAQTVYVNGNNPTPGDGSDWATAYTNLNDALLAAPSGAEVWIAAGTYVTPDTASFFIDKELTVRGGFSGSETDASQADPSVNATVLSGDVLGNDSPTAYDSLAYLDNNVVLFVTDTNQTSAYTVTLDGFTIAHGGIAANYVEGNFFPFLGAGLRSVAKLAASRLTFTRNRSSFGSAIGMISLTASGSVFDDITVTENYAGPNRQIYLNTIDDITFENSSFSAFPDSMIQSGMFRVFACNDLLIDNCTFRDINTDFFAGGMRIENCDDVLVRNTSFDDMTSGRGTGLMFQVYNDYVTDRVRDEDDYVVESCTFNNLRVLGSDGGATSSFNCNQKIINCSVNNCIAEDNAGAFYMETFGDSGTEFNFILKNDTINGNEGLNDFGGAITVLPFNTTTIKTEINDCIFTNNASKTASGDADGRGGAIYVQGNEGTVIIENSRFDENLARFGGAVRVQGEEGTVSVTNCQFNENIGGSGGGISTFGTNEYTIEESTFSKNIAEAGSGFLVSGNSGITLRNSKFIENGNSTDSYRGAFTGFIEGGKGIVVDSCEFSENIIGDNASFLSAGGAIYLFGASTEALPLTITNTDFQNNATLDGSGGGAIFLVRGFDVDIDNCNFLGNSAAGDGGAFGYTMFSVSQDTVGEDITVNYPPYSVDVTNSSFISNLSQTQGGAVSTQRVGMNFTNSVFVSNAIGDGGNSGGAIIFNGNSPIEDAATNLLTEDDVQLEATLIHNTFLNNTKGMGDAAVGSNIAVFQPGTTTEADSNSAKLTLLNNAFFSGDGSASIEVEVAGANVPPTITQVGKVSFSSLGGNVFNSLNGPDVVLEDGLDVIDENLPNAEALFVDPTALTGDFADVRLLITDPVSDNPLINTAVVSELVPAFDREGNPRGEAPDVGAYEADQSAVSTDTPVAQSGLQISFFPNPTRDVLNIRNEDPTISRFTVLIADQQGRTLDARQFSGTNNALDLNALPVGIYNLRLLVNGRIYGQQVVKQ